VVAIPVIAGPLPVSFRWETGNADGVPNREIDVFRWNSAVFRRIQAPRSISREPRWSPTARLATHQLRYESWFRAAGCDIVERVEFGGSFPGNATMPAAKTIPRVLVSSLPLPSEVRRQIDVAACRSAVERSLLRDRLLLRHHFGGNWIATVESERGLELVARVPDGAVDVFEEVSRRCDLTRDERGTLRIEFVDRGPTGHAEVQTPVPVYEER
jgi:hypothetical protein